MTYDIWILIRNCSFWQKWNKASQKWVSMPVVCHLTSTG